MKRNSISLYLSGFLLLSSSAFLSAQVVSNYTGWMNDYDGTEAGTMFLYKFDNPATQNTSPNSAVGGPNPDRYLVVSVDGTTRGVAGKFGTGFQVDNPYTNASSTGYAQMGPSHIFNNTTTPYISVEFWYSTPNTSPGDSLNYFIDYQYSSNLGFQMYTPLLSDGKAVHISIGNGESRLSATSANLDWASNQFYHLAFTYNALEGELLLYRDGEVIARTVNAEFGNIANYEGVLRLGNRVGSTYRNTPGIYDNFRISDALYQYSAIPEPGTIALIFGIGALALVITRRHRNS